ncbi:MAG: N-6 DNA methylase [Candidatus Marithrix sp.]
MNQQILNFLKEYSTDVKEINKLLISAFLELKSISKVKNKLIQELIINNKSKNEFLQLLEKTNQKLCFEELLELFEFVISPSDKLVNGAIYTPKNIREYITKQSFKQLHENLIYEKIKVVDISCGCGGFLIDATKELKTKTSKSYKNIFKENIFGVDIQPYSVERTKILLALLAITEKEDELEFCFNIYQGDSLEFDWQQHKFDLILGNPPYVCSRNMDQKTRKLIDNWTTCSTGHPDLYIPFFQIGFELLKPKGVLGFITVNSFINSVNGRAIRKYFETKRALLKIIDFGDEQIFKSRMTYTCICIIQNIISETVFYTIKPVNMDVIRFKQEHYLELDAYKGWNLKDNAFVNKMESKGIPFSEIYDTKHGIATLKNNIYIFKPIKSDNYYYYMADNTLIEKDICKDIINSNKLARYKQLDELKEKIIFPYTHDEQNRPFLIDEDRFKDKYPKAYKYLLSNKDILATRDKGKGKYPAWYSFGRNQSLERRKHKLFFPNLVKKGFPTFLNDDENLYFYNGMAAYASKKELIQLEKIMLSDIFWKYIENKAKYYASGYYGLGKNYLKDFGI